MNKKDLPNNTPDYNSGLLSLNNFMLEQSEINLYEKLVNSIVGQLDVFFKPIATIYSEFDDRNKSLRIKAVKANQGVLSSATKIGGKKIFTTITPVNDDMYKKMTVERIEIVSNLYEISGRAIPKAISTAIDKALGVKCFLGLSYMIDDQIYGTTIIALKEKPDSFYIELMKTYAHFTSISLKRVLTEQSLRENEQKYRNIADNVTDVVWVADMNFTVTYVSPSVERMLGETVEEYTQKTLEQKFPPQSLNSILKVFQEEMEKEKDPSSDKNRTRVLEAEHYKADGKTIWISMHISALRDSRGNIAGFQGVARDITDRKKAEKLLQLQVSERAAVDAFTYSVSNDLKAPLRRIEGFSEMLMEECRDQLNERAQEYLNRILAHIDSMKDLTDALLLLAKVVSHGIEREQVDLSALFRSQIEKHRHSEPNRQVKTIVKPGMMVFADTELVSIALFNLINNSWKFTDITENACLEIGCLKQEKGTVYYIKDNGIGFEMRFTNIIFEPFQKLHTDYAGIGIGLNIAYRIISRHGGEIWAEGEVGKGATFYFTIPNALTI